MPLLGKRPYEPRPVSLRDLTHTDEVWVIRFTDEVFHSYEEYIERWEHYRQRVWGCRYTGRTGLTYEEALVSEADATHLSVQIPEEQLAEMALLMHKFVGGLEALVEHVQKHFRDTAKSGKTTPTKAIIKQVVRIVADKEPYKGAPWMLKEDFCRKHSLTVSRELPPALAEARERYAERHKLDLGAAANGGEHDDENEPAGDEANEPSRAAKRSRVRKGPKDDLELEGADAQPPTPCSDFIIEQRYVGDMLMAFNFLISYRQKLGIQRTFTLGDFESALINDDLCEFMEESLVRLLKSVYHNDPNASRINADTSDAALWKWLKAAKLLDPSVSLPGVKLSAMKDQFFHTQPANVKIPILALLVRACLDSAATRQHLDESYETSLELQKEEKEQEQEEKQRERITAAFERKKKQTELNLEKMVAKLRAVPLGFDRHHRRYWFWPAAGPRLWVETPPASFYDSLSIPRPPSLQEPVVVDGNGDESSAQHKGEEDKRQNGGSSAERMEDEEEETEAKATADKAEPKKETKDDKKGKQKKGKKENGETDHMEEETKKEKEDEASAEEEDKESDDDDEEDEEKEENEEVPQEENVDVSSWAYYDTIEQVDELIQFLNEEGPREKELKASLERKHQKILDAMSRTFHSTRASQRAVMVPQYDLPVRRSSRIAGARPRR